MEQKAAIVALAVAMCAGCGDPSGDSNGIELNGVTARDKEIAARLDAYIERNYANGRQPLPSQGNLPSPQRRATSKVSDNVAELQRSIGRISVDGTVITIETSLHPDAEGLQTARLICTVIYGADVADFTKGHRVVGPDSTPLARYSPGTSPLDQ